VQDESREAVPSGEGLSSTLHVMMDIPKFEMWSISALSCGTKTDTWFGGVAHRQPREKTRETPDLKLVKAEDDKIVRGACSCT
jgi:hypothetical protein